MTAREPAFRYTPLAKIASGGTATVYVGARRGDRTLVAIKRPHPHVLEDERQRAGLLREARLASSFQHPNIVLVRLVENAGSSLQLVMDYVEGSAFGTLIALAAKEDRRVPTPVSVRVVLDACAGVHSVHEHRDAEGRVLGLVHRDVSPQNILVGLDGVARVTDFGLAKAVYEGAPSTTQGTLKGKLGYMAPEYVNRGQLDRGIDVFALGVVLWEALAGRRLFRGDNEAQTLDRILHAEAECLSVIAGELAPFDGVVARALAKDPNARFATAEDFRSALEVAAGAVHALATHDEVAAYVRYAVEGDLARRRAEIEQALIRQRRTRARPVVLAIAGVALLATVFGSPWMHFEPKAQSPSASRLGSTFAPSPIATPPGTPLASAPPFPATSSPDPDDAAPDPPRAGATVAPRPRVAPPRQPPPNPYVHRR